MGDLAARFQIVTLFPDLIEAFTSHGVISQGCKKGLLEVTTINPRRFTHDVHQSVDDRPFGGRDGMIMQAEPLQQALDFALAQAPQAKCLYLSPQGERLTDAKVQEFAQNPSFILICGRYGGIDNRFLVKNQIREISIGDYVLSGGELAASVLIDAIGRQIPGVLGHADSADRESFREGTLEAPQFTRPREWQGLSVPEILLSGNHGKIEEWRHQISMLVTLLKRPDLPAWRELSSAQKKKIHQLWQTLSEQDKKSLGLTGLSEASFT